MTQRTMAHRRLLHRSLAMLQFVALAAFAQGAGRTSPPPSAAPSAAATSAAAPVAVPTSNPSLVRALTGRYEQRRVEDGGIVGVEHFRIAVHPDGTRSLVIWNDLRERGSQMNVTLTAGPDFRAREAYARYWTAGRYRGSALVRVDGAQVTLDSVSASGAPGHVTAEAPARLSLATHPVSGDGWHVAAMQLDGQRDGYRGTARAFSLDPGGEADAPLLGRLVDIPVERVGRERVDVPAGAFDALHVRIAGVSDYWITGDDWIVVKARIRNREYVLVELQPQPR